VIRSVTALLAVALHATVAPATGQDTTSSDPALRIVVADHDSADVPDSILNEYRKLLDEAVLYCPQYSRSQMADTLIAIREKFDERLRRRKFVQEIRKRLEVSETMSTYDHARLFNFWLSGGPEGPRLPPAIGEWCADVIEMSTTGRTPYSLVRGQGIIDKIFWLYERTPSWVSWLIAAGLALFAVVMFFFIGSLPTVAASGLKYGLRLLGFGLAKDTPRPDGAEPQQHATSPGASRPRLEGLPLYYDLLGLEPDASPDEVSHAYRELHREGDPEHLRKGSEHRRDAEMRLQSIEVAFGKIRETWPESTRAEFAKAIEQDADQTGPRASVRGFRFSDRQEVRKLRIGLVVLGVAVALALLASLQNPLLFVAASGAVSFYTPWIVLGKRKATLTGGPKIALTVLLGLAMFFWLVVIGVVIPAFSTS